MKADLDFIYSKNIRLTPDAYEFLEKNEFSQQVIDRIASCDSSFITKEMIEAFRSTDDKIPVQVTVSRSPDFRPLAKEYSPNFRVLEASDISGKSCCTGKIEEFVEHFRNRFERISKVLKARITPNPTSKTDKLKATAGTRVRLIAMVTYKRTTKKGNYLLDVEDEDGTAKVVIPKDTEAFKVANKLLLDDVVAFDGKNADELFICDEVTWTEMPFASEQRKTENDIAVAYLSDLHFGSKKFLEKEFMHFVSWLNGGVNDKRELAGKVKYIVIAGDIVDGIGIYPEQEKELAVKDIYKQYEMFDNAISKIPDYVTVIAGPGNHDAVRRAEPQPQIPQEFLKSDVVRIGSPSNIVVEGIKHLVYHGTSLDSIIAGMTGLSYNKPEEAMLEIIRRRHLSPIYGDNLIVPEARDYLVIEDEPDVLHMGHVHKNGYMYYRGTLLLNSGTFQDQTDFQVRMGHKPTPCVVPVLEAKTAKLNHISFMGA